jgi:hypothetical protein
LKTGVAALAARYAEALAKLPPKDAARQRSRKAPALAPFPRMRPAGTGEDPETWAARHGELPFAAYVPELVAEAPRIRFVGEDYYAELHDPSRPEPPTPEHRPPLGFDLIASAKAHAALQAAETVATQ